MLYTNKKKSKFNLIKLVLFIFALLLLMMASFFFVNYKYTQTLDNFYFEFSNSNYDNAKKVHDKNIIFTLKKKSLNNDLNTYFTSIVKNTCNELKNNDISNDEALNIFKEIHKYNVLSSSLDKLILSLDKDFVPTGNMSSESTLNLAIQKYESKDYTGALELLSKIPSSDDAEYSSAKTYIDKCKTDYKTELFEKADELIANKYYTKAIDLLSTADTNIVSKNDEDIKKKISFTQMVKDEYLAYRHLDDAAYTSNAIMQAITTENINTLNIESKTSYLLYVNLDEQKTYIYKGAKDNWSLLDSFSCSTGIAGKETPKGMYSVTGRGDWFFSDEFQQGGKYWVQFMGDYLFHSLPYNQAQSEVVDYTLGVPASHGCIRLEDEKAKWIYDNVPDDTKVIIN